MAKDEFSSLMDKIKNFVSVFWNPYVVIGRESLRIFLLKYESLKEIRYKKSRILWYISLRGCSDCGLCFVSLACLMQY